jgi:uncharacterized protein (AIM24 family)
MVMMGFRILIFGAVFLLPLTVFPQAMTHLWSQSFGDASEQWGIRVAFDPSGNVVITGFFRGTVNFGGGPLTSAGSRDIFLTKYDTNGNHLWSQSFGDTSTQIGSSVAFDPSGNVVMTGSFVGTVDFGGGSLTSAGGYDIFLAKFDSAGNHIWSQGFGDASIEQYSTSVAFDPSENVILTGFFEGTVDFGGGLLTSAGGYDIFLAKFDSDGNHLWSQSFGDSSDIQRGSSVAFDSSGNVIMSGDFQGTVDFGGGSLTSAGGYDIFLAKFDANGTHLWSHRFGDGNIQTGYYVAFDPSGNVLMTGYFMGTVDFGGGSLISSGWYDIFLVKFDSSGTHLWSQKFGDASTQYCLSVAIGPLENIITTGYFEGTVDFGGGPLTSAGGYDIFLAKFDSGGNHLWSQGFGDASDIQRGFSVACDSSGNVIMTGYFEGTVDFGGGSLISSGWYDIFLAKFGANVGIEESNDEYRTRNIEFGLLQNSPNPFHNSTVIRYQIPIPNPESRIKHHVSLKVYDLTGRLVETIVNENKDPGVYQVHWESRTPESGVRSGIYFYKLSAGDNTQTKKMILLR